MTFWMPTGGSFKIRWTAAAFREPSNARVKLIGPQNSLSQFSIGMPLTLIGVSSMIASGFRPFCNAVKNTNSLNVDPACRRASSCRPPSAGPAGVLPASSDHAGHHGPRRSEHSPGGPVGQPVRNDRGVGCTLPIALLAGPAVLLTHRRRWRIVKWGR